MISAVPWAYKTSIKCTSYLRLYLNIYIYLFKLPVVVVLTHYCDCDHERCLPIIWTLQLLFIVRVVPSGFELGDKPGNWLYNRDRLIASSVPLTIPRWVVPSDPVEFNKTGAEQGGDKLDTPPQNTIHKRRAGYLGRYLLLQLSKDCPRNCTFRIICYSLLRGLAILTCNSYFQQGFYGFSELLAHFSRVRWLV